MAGPLQSRHIGCACRIYRNANNTILAIDDIDIVGNTVQIGNNVNVRNNPYPKDLTVSSRWHHQATMKYRRELFHLAADSRTIASIQMLGDYKAIETISGNYLSATWTGADSQDDLEVSLSELPKVGDSI